MQIIAHKSNLYHNREFMEMIKENRDKIQGIMLDVVLTKDKRVLVFSPVTTNQTTINTIQNSNFADISFFDVFLLEDALKMSYQENLKIILNLLPLNEATVLEQYQTIVWNNEEYAQKVLDIITKFQGLNLYLCSSSYNLLYVLKRKIFHRKLGVILDLNNSNYIDVDFYIFSSEMLQKNILKQQLEIGKEVMLFMDNADDMTRVVNFLGQKPPDMLFIKQMQYITNYPGLLYMIFDNSFFEGKMDNG